jgi:membrane-anchored protein YejM (alkaline phosphatase superfamily)
VTANPVDVKLVETFNATSTPPHVFLFIIDSLRRDYLSPYNDAITFTPSIGRFARESLVFERTFSRYGATGLALPSIWAGGMLLHMQYVRPFDRMNALAKLLEAADYRLLMSRDTIVHQLMPVGPSLVQLDRGTRNINFELCHTLAELESKLAKATADGGRVFGYTLPQDVHMVNSFRRPVAGGDQFEGLYPPVAATVRQIDSCFGTFVDSLKRAGLYDDSIIILTSDHGDSLGEEGRWGHAYTVFPEVIQIPLIVHLPAALSGSVRADLSRLSFSTDITPTLYRLLGYEPADLGSSYGRPLISFPNDVEQATRDDAARRTGSFLVASSYGAVYGILSQNGDRLYIADAVDGRDYAYDLTKDGPGERLSVTERDRVSNWRLIQEQISQIARQYQFTPES